MFCVSQYKSYMIEVQKLLKWSFIGYLHQCLLGPNIPNNTLQVVTVKCANNDQLMGGIPLKAQNWA